MTKEELLQKLTIVSMNHAGITALDKPIIGTHSLATCLGILLYDEEQKIAIVAHATTGDPNIAMNEVLTIIKENNLEFAKFKYKVFDGYYKEGAEFYHTKEEIVKYIRLNILFNIPFSEEEIPSTALIKNPNLEANEFYFDASTGKFVTSEALALLLEDNTITEDVTKPRHR